MANTETGSAPRPKLHDGPQATNETIASAAAIRDAVALGPEIGLHRHEILQKLGMGKTRYAAALRFAVRSNWVRTTGWGLAARVVKVLGAEGDEP